MDFKTQMHITECLGSACYWAKKAENYSKKGNLRKTKLALEKARRWLRRANSSFENLNNPTEDNPE